MKITKLLLITSALLLAGCNKSNSSQNSEISSDISSNSQVSSESSRSLPKEVSESEWGVEAATACYDTIGTVIPYMEAEAFEYKVTEDDYGDPCIWFYLYYDTQEIAEAKIIDYANIAYEKGNYECVVQPTRFQDPNDYSSWIQNVLYADKPLSYTNAVEIQGLDSIKAYEGKSMGCLGLFCFNYIPNNNPNVFPSYAVSTVCGRFNDVPKLEGKDLTFSFQFFLYEGYKCLEIVVTSNTSYYELEEQYFYALLGKMFTIVQYDDLEQDFTNVGFFQTGEYPEFEDCKCYYAYPNGANYIVYFDYDLNKQAFYIDILPLLG